MRIAISQPEHFPYLGYFQKMHAADIFVILDDVEFSGRGSYQNRNRYTNSTGEEEWFTVPIEKDSYRKLIKDVKTAPDFGWRKKLAKKLQYHFKMDFQDVYEPEMLREINMKSIHLCREALGIKTPMYFSSSIPTVGNKVDRLISICKYFDGDTYISGEGAKGYMNVNEFIMEGIEVTFLRPRLSTYDSSIIHLSGNSTGGNLSELMKYDLYVPGYPQEELSQRRTRV